MPQFTDSLKDFWIKKILLPKVFRIDIPGYIIGKFYTPTGQNVFVRNIFMPENFFFYLESFSKNLYGEEGLSRLYSAAKKFGYNFAYINKLSTTNPNFSIDLVIKFFESLYAEELVPEVNTSIKYVELLAKELFVTRLNGEGESISVGGFAGICSYIYSDFKNIDCGVLKIDDSYKLICGTTDILDRKKVQHFSFNGDIFLLDSRYKLFNTPIQKPFSIYSLNKFLEGGIFLYKKGSLKFSITDIRFAPVEISLVYLFEKSIDVDIIYNAAKTSFTEIGNKIKNIKNSYVFLSEILTALGYGVVNLSVSSTEYNFNFDGFPWSNDADSSKMPFLKGVIEGFLIGQGCENFKVENIKSELTNNKFIVSVSVKK